MNNNFNDFRLSWYTADTHQFVASTTVSGKSVTTLPDRLLHLPTLRIKHKGLICLNPDYGDVAEILNQIKLDQIVNPPNTDNHPVRFFGDSKDLLGHICTIVEDEKNLHYYLGLYNSEPN
jgi:hypothetical protein